MTPSFDSPDLPSEATPLFAVRVEVDHGVTVVRLAGELDMASAPHLSAFLDTACALPANTVVVDVARLSFMDAFGVRALVDAHNRLLEEGQDGLVVHGAARVVRKVLATTDLPFVSEEEEGPACPLCSRRLA